MFPLDVPALSSGAFIQFALNQSEFTSAAHQEGFSSSSVESLQRPCFLLTD